MSPGQEPNPERLLIDQVAARYRDRGYEVLVEPKGDQAPRFLRPFVPDLIAHRGQDSVVIEIKRGRSEEHRHSLEALAAEVAKHAGWRLDIVLGEDPLSEFGASLDDFPSSSKLQAQLAEGVELLNSGHIVAGGLLIWASFEGAARLMALTEKLDTSLDAPPMSVIRDLVSHGLLDDEEFGCLTSAFRRRNGLVHGFSATSGDGELFQAVHKIALKLLDEQNSGTDIEV